MEQAHKSNSDFFFYSVRFISRLSTSKFSNYFNLIVGFLAPKCHFCPIYQSFSHFPKTDGDIADTEDKSYDVEVDNKNVGNGNGMVLVEPRAYSESQQIVDNLKKRNSIVVNLKRVTNDQAKRIIDFLSGALYALGGDIQKLGNGIYLCTPKNVHVEGKITDEEESKKSRSLW